MSDKGQWFDMQANYAQKSQEAVDTANGIEKPKEFKSTLDKDSFLRLLITQLQYQDPLNPVEDKEFVAQMAQFSALEEMQNMNKATTKAQAFSMIGKSIYSIQYNSTTGEYDEIEGQVTSVLLLNNQPYLMVGNKQVSLDSVEEVYGSYESYLMSNVNNNLVNNQNLTLIGKSVQAITVDGEKTEFVEGIVDQVKFTEKGTAILVVEGKEVLAGEVISVSDKPLLLGNTVGYVADNSGAINYGKVTGVNFADDKAYLVINGKQVLVDKINYVSDALKLVTKEITFQGSTDTVNAVIMRGGTPYLKIGDRELSFLSYRGIKTEEEDK